jgi:hypothetical protein
MIPAFKLALRRDTAVHVNPREMGECREFRIADGASGFAVFYAPCVWDREAAKQMPVVKNMGVFQGDVVCYIQAWLLPRMPVAGELIYSPANSPYEVISCTDEEGIYVMNLFGTRSHPARYGKN